MDARESPVDQDLSVLLPPPCTRLCLRWGSEKHAEPPRPTNGYDRDEDINVHRQLMYQRAQLYGPDLAGLSANNTSSTSSGHFSSGVVRRSSDSATPTRNAPPSTSYR